MTTCAHCGLPDFERAPDGRLICANCDQPAPVARLDTASCSTFRCGQPVPTDSQPWQRCLSCGQPIKIARRPARASVR